MSPSVFTILSCSKACPTRRLTLPSSGRSYGTPLKSNVRALFMSSLRLSSSLPRRVFVHGLVLPFRLGSRHSREVSLPHASACVVPLARLQGCGQKIKVSTAHSILRVFRQRLERNHSQLVRRRHLRRYASLPLGRSPRLPSRPNLKHEYEVQFSSCLCSPASRSLSAWPSLRSALLGAFPTRALTSPSSGLAFGSPLK